MDYGVTGYAPMYTIKSPVRNDNFGKTRNEQNCSSNKWQFNDPIMVTKEKGQTPVEGILPDQEDTEDSDMDHKSDPEISDSVNTLEAAKTKIKLNFSVDRLLEADCGDSRRARIQKAVISTNNDGEHLVNNDGQYEYCKYLNHQSQMERYHLQKHHQLISHRNQLERRIPLAPSLDIKAVVRPTPIRAVGSGQDEVLSYSSMASSILKYHQRHQHQQPPPASIAALSSLMAPFNGLKSLQVNQQHFRQQANIQSASKSLDIPPTTPATQSSSGGGSISNSAASASSSVVIGNGGKRKRSWSRAVFSNLQRKGLEIQFQQQKYITKPDRRKLAARLNLTDAQVKVWFQNRRMKWRHTRENLKSGQEKTVSTHNTPNGNASTSTCETVDVGSTDKKCYTSSSESDDDEIDVVQ